MDAIALLSINLWEDYLENIAKTSGESFAIMDARQWRGRIVLLGRENEPLLSANSCQS